MVFSEYADRLRNVQTCLENEKRPMYNFQQISKEGWDAKEQQKQQDMLWNKLLPGSIERAISTFAGACNEMIAAWTLTANELLKKSEGKLVDCSKLPTLKTQLDPNWDLASYVDEDSEDTPLTGSDTMLYEQVLHKTRITLQNELIELELQAVEACMDDVGWVLPDDERARGMLQDMIVHQLVQPVERSGTGVPKAFLFPGTSDHRSDVRQEREIEDLDMLDTAGW